MKMKWDCFYPLPPRAFQKVVSKQELTLIFTLLFGASKCSMKAFKDCENCEEVWK